MCEASDRDKVTKQNKSKDWFWVATYFQTLLQRAISKSKYAPCLAYEPYTMATKCKKVVHTSKRS